MFPTLFNIGSFRIGTYGVMMAIGVLTAVKAASKECEKAGFSKDRFYNFVLLILLSAIVGARVLYILVEWKDFVDYPFSYIFSREGFVFYGGLIGAFAAGTVYVRRAGLSVGRTADLCAPYIALGHALGRIGCFLNGCCYGLQTDSVWGMPIQGLPGKYFPIQLVASAFLFALFGFLYRIRERIGYKGMLFLLYVTFYASGRFVIEFFRGDPRGTLLGIFATSQELCLMMVIVGIVGMALVYRSQSVD